MKVIVKTPASCGELVQGYINGNEFLINAPIPMYASAHIKMTESIFEEKNLISNGFSKSAKAVQQLLNQINIQRANFEIDIESSIPRNKGLSSSTAEISAALFGIASALNQNISYEDISKHIISVDGSSDAVFLDGITHINQLKGDICRRYFNIPNISFIIVDAGGEIQTQEFDRKFARHVAQKHEFSLKRALDLIDKGFKQQNPHLIAQAATISARINQYIHYKSSFNTLLEGTREFGALGVNCAHTGTVLGVMFDHTQTDCQVLEERVVSLMGSSQVLGSYPLISGIVDIEIYDEFGVLQKNLFEEQTMQIKLA